MARWACFQASSFGYVMPAHTGDRAALRRTWKAAPHGDAWLHEPKLDGYRFQIVKDGLALRLYSRTGYARIRGRVDT